MHRQHGFAGFSELFSNINDGHRAKVIDGASMADYDLRSDPPYVSSEQFLVLQVIAW